MDKIRVETLKKKIAYDLANSFDWTTVIALCLQDHINRTELETMLKYGTHNTKTFNICYYEISENDY